MLKTETNIELIGQKRWNKFVESHSNGNIFQSPYIYELYENTVNYQPNVLFCIENNELVGVLLSVKQKEGRGIIGFFTSRFIIIGGPIAKDNRTDIIDKLLFSHNKLYKNKGIYTQIRNLHDTNSYEKSFLINKFKFEDHLDIHIGLKIDKEEFWSSLKPKLRQNIRKAEKNGVTIEIASLEDAKSIFNILKEVYKKAKLPIPPESLIIQSFEILLKTGQLLPFVAKHENKIIGCRLALLYSNVIYDWYAGSLSKYSKLNINDFLPYKTIEWGINNKEYSTFDFGGAGKPNIPYGVRDHKLKFRNELINLGRYNYYHKPILYKIMVLLYKIWQKIQK